jgi:P pilus assembly chaperone PapD
MIRKIAFLLCSVAALWAPVAGADLRVSRFFVETEPEGRPAEVFVENNGQETAYVRIRIDEVIDPQDPEPEELANQSPEQMGLLVSPQRLVLAPGEEKRIRIVSLKNPEKDRFFRMTVTPVVGDLESEAAIGVKLLIAYGVWIFARPENAEPRLDAAVSGRTLNLTNNGNTHTEIRAIRLCADVNIPSECETLSGFRLLSGRSRAVSFETAGTAIVRSEFRGKLDEAQFIIR